MALTSGNVTIKASGGTYSSWASFWNDLGNLTGDITCTIDAGAYTENTAPSFITETLGGYSITVQPSAYPTTTDATTGVRINFGNNVLGGTTFFYDSVNTTGTINIKGIAFIMPTINDASYIMFIYNSSTNEKITYNISRCIFKGGGIGINIGTYGMAPIYNIYSNIFYDQNISTSSRAFNVQEGFKTEHGHFSNNTIDLDGFGLYCGMEGLYENNLIFTCSNQAIYNANKTGNNGSNNSTYDGTGDDWGGTNTNNRINKSTDPFINRASDDYRLAQNADPCGNGKDLSAKFTADFFGNTRTSWDIGACEYVSLIQNLTLTATEQTYTITGRSLNLVRPPVVVQLGPREGSEEDHTPVLQFSGLDRNGLGMEFEIQIDTAATFNSGNLLGADSSTDQGFSPSHPYTSLNG